MKLLNKNIPDFKLNNQDDKLIESKNFIGNWTLLYFYPKDDTPGCTQQACGIRDNYESFQKAKVSIYGINADSSKSHKKFKEKYELPFDLLSDPERTVIEMFEVWGEKSFMGKKYTGIFRNSFLINPEGILVKIYENVKPAEHADTILKDVAELTGKLS